MIIMLDYSYTKGRLIEKRSIMNYIQSRVDNHT
jgi:hypothetical protein